jgi:hypothetical protein
VHRFFNRQAAEKPEPDDFRLLLAKGGNLPDCLVKRVQDIRRFAPSAAPIL